MMFADPTLTLVRSVERGGVPWGAIYRRPDGSIIALAFATCPAGNVLLVETEAPSVEQAERWVREFVERVA